MRFVEVKGLAGGTYVRATDVMAIQIVDQYKCNIIMVSGNSIPLVEPAGTIVERIEKALASADASPAETR